MDDQQKLYNCLLLDQRDAVILSMNQLSKTVAEISLSESGKPILLNKQAIQFVMTGLQTLLEKMEDDTLEDGEAVYSSKTMKPWWM